MSSIVAFEWFVIVGCNGALAAAVCSNPDFMAFNGAFGDPLQSLLCSDVDSERFIANNVSGISITLVNLLI